jgi:hypothetical protein
MILKEERSGKDGRVSLYYINIRLGQLRKSMKHLRENNRSIDRYSKCVPDV